MKTENSNMRVSLDEALLLVRENIKILGTEVIPVDEACGRTAAEDITAEIPQPPFPKSAMDGYAIRKADFTPDCILPVTDEADAGDTRVLCLEKGKAIRIMTGARIPEGADMVVPQELTDYGEEAVRISGIPKFSNICPIGEDFEAGAVLVRCNSFLSAASVSCLTAAGVTEIKVFRRPSVAVVCTGDELVSPGNGLLSGQIYDSNGAYLKSRLLQLGCTVIRAVAVRDDEALISAELNRCLEDGADYILTAGGVSVGKKDYMEKILSGLGAEIKFHGVAVKPGMPTMFSLLSGTPVLSLSGNPYSSAALFEYLFPYKRTVSLQTVLSEPFENKHPVPRLVRGFFNGYSVEPALHQKNGSTWTDIEANCIAKIPPAEVKEISAEAGNAGNTGNTENAEGSGNTGDTINEKNNANRMNIVNGIKVGEPVTVYLI